MSEMPGTGPEVDDFTPSFLVEKAEDLDVVHPGFKKKLEKLHAFANTESIKTNRDLWVRELDGMSERLEVPLAGEEPYDIAETIPFLDRITKHIQSLDQDGIPEPLDPSVRSFTEVAREISDLIDNPNPAREAVVKKEMEVLGNYAKNIGVFEDVKTKVEQHQQKNDFLVAAKKIRNMDLTNSKNEARNLVGWDPRLEGMVETYRWAAFYNMMKAWKESSGDRPDTLINQNSWDQLDKWVEYLNYEDPPYRKLSNAASAELTKAGMLGRVPTERGVREPLPTYFGAVFEGGARAFYAEHESIQILDVTKEQDRQIFILENLDAFNRYFANPLAWQAARKDWLYDFNVAADAKGLGSKERAHFEKTLNAMMGVTAQARAMEGSLGVADKYLAILCGSEKGSTDIQDEAASLLVHADPEKLNFLLKDPLVKKYYDTLMNDAGLVNNPNYEWQVDIQDPDYPTDPTKKKTIGSRVELRGRNGDEKQATKERVLQGRLVKRLKDYAKEGGVASYVEEVLLARDNVTAYRSRGITDDSRRAAAQIACDIFLVDKWTRWQRLIDEKDKLDVQPIGDWGGDPFRSIESPALVPEGFKKVYVNSPVMRMLESAFNPVDILGGDPRKFGIQPNSELAQKLYEQRIIPSGATNVKTIMRYNAALNAILDGSRAPGIASWDKDGMANLETAKELLDQVYGGRSITITQRGRKVKIPIGKEIVGAQVSRLIDMKAMALAEEVLTKPDFRMKMARAMGAENDTAVFDMAIRMIWGAEHDAKTGYIAKITSPREGLRTNPKTNRFHAQKNLDHAWNILWEMDAQAKGRSKAARAGILLRMAQDVMKDAPEFK